MQAYLNKGKELIKLLLNNGYEAYFVGEIVRNIIIGVNYKRADIITNANFEAIRRIFKVPTINIFEGDIELEDENSLKVTYLDYDFYFHQFVCNEANLISENRIAFTKHYSKNLSDDLATKNFTINAIAMSYSGKLTDVDEGCKDVVNRKIRTVGSPKQKFITSPIEILNALVIASELKFKISDKTYKMMKKKARLLQDESIEKITNALKSILENQYAKYALRLLINANIHKHIPSLSKGIHKLASKYRQISFDELVLMNFVMNKQIDDRYLEYVENVVTFKKIFNLACDCPKGKYSDMQLFTYGLDVCLEANFINFIIGKSKLRTKAIKKAYESLPIKNKKNLKYTEEDIARITDINDANIITDILNTACKKVLSGEIKNEFNEIQTVVLKALTERGILYDLERKAVVKPIVSVSEDEEVLKKTFNTDYNKNFYEANYNDRSHDLTEDEQSISNQLNQNNADEDFTNHRLRVLEERLDQQDRMLKEKNERLKELEYQKVLETTSKVVNNTMELVKKDSQVNSMIEDVNDFELHLRSFIVGYLERDKNDEEN